MENPFRANDRLMAELHEEVLKWADLADRMGRNGYEVQPIRFTDTYDKVRLDDYDG